MSNWWPYNFYIRYFYEIEIGSVIWRTSSSNICIEKLVKAPNSNSSNVIVVTSEWQYTLLKKSGWTETFQLKFASENSKILTIAADNK